MIPDLIPAQAKVISFYVPYYSEESGEERMVLFSSGQQFVVADCGCQMREPVVLDGSDSPMQMDVLREKYFRFLAKYG